jgi:hypothetical protein
MARDQALTTALSNINDGSRKAFHRNGHLNRPYASRWSLVPMVAICSANSTLEQLSEQGDA